MRVVSEQKDARTLRAKMGEKVGIKREKQTQYEYEGRGLKRDMWAPSWWKYDQRSYVHFSDESCVFVMFWGSVRPKNGSLSEMGCRALR